MNSSRRFIFCSEGALEISQKQGVWITANDKIRPERTAGIHRPFRTNKHFGFVTSHFVAG
jgi:hypothetical protein